MSHDHPRARYLRLSPRQLEILSLLCEGLSNKVIALRLNIAVGTVKVHIGVILRELGAASRLQAVVAARRCGLIPPGAATSAGAAMVDTSPGLALSADPAPDGASQPATSEY